MDTTAAEPTQPKQKKIYGHYSRKPCEWVGRDGHKCPRFCQKTYILPMWAAPKYMCCYHNPEHMRKHYDFLNNKYHEKAETACANREPIILDLAALKHAD